MRKAYFIFLAGLFLGCSSKDVFVPKKSEPKQLKEKSLYTKYLKDYTQKTLTFKELHLIYKKPTSFIDDGVWGEWVDYDLNSTELGKFKKVDGDLAVYGDKLKLIKEKKVFKMPFLIASASKKGNLVAVVFENNALGLFDVTSERMVAYKELDDSDVIAIRYMRAKPVVVDDIVVYPALNSKVYLYIISKKEFKPLDFSSYQMLDNVIYLKYLKEKDRLIIASPYKVAVIGERSVEVVDKYKIKHIITMDDNIYIFTIDGRVLEYDLDLKKLKSVDLAFADYFAPGICNNKIYTLTSNGYLVSFDKNLNYKVYQLENSLDLYSPLRIKGCKIYNQDKVYEIE